MKIGIMTFHWAHNYGAALQVYALSSYLERTLGADVRIIDFRTERQEKVNNILPRIGLHNLTVKRLGRYLVTLCSHRSLNRRRSRFEEFSRECFTHTRHYADYKALSTDPPLLDCVICGSDQVFNPRVVPEEELMAYCLKPPFPSQNTRKIAYAPSFGSVDIPDCVREAMGACLKEFEYLSAREQDGADLLGAMTGKRVPRVLDPVFLLEADDWRAISRPVDGVQPPYILCYALNGRRALDAMVAKVKQLTGLPIVLLTSNVVSHIRADKTIYDAGPREFVWLMDNAGFIVTDSFHGQAFANLFEKPFYSQIATPYVAERIRGFLRILSLEDRIANDADAITTDTLALDFSRSKTLLAEKRADSVAYLSGALSPLGQTNCSV